jgi:hypothetical protein
MSVDDGFSRTELELADQRRLPAPHELVGMLRAQLDNLVNDARNGRGEIAAPEDTFDMQRGLAAVHEGLTDYARAFSKIAKEALGYVQDELIEAVGEQDGIPMAGLKVPDLDGTTISIELDKTNEYTFDHDALRSAVAYSVLMARRGEDPTRGVRSEEVDNWVVSLMIDAMTLLETLGQFRPQVTKVRAFTAELSRLPGGDLIASTVTSTTRKNPLFKGVKVKREFPR